MHERLQERMQLRQRRRLCRLCRAAAEELRAGACAATCACGCRDGACGCRVLALLALLALLHLPPLSTLIILLNLLPALLPPCLGWTWCCSFVPSVRSSSIYALM